MSMLRNAALHYALFRKWPVFPCKGKIPLTDHGFKDASLEQAQIEEWWTRYPSANIGIPTGVLTFNVIDADGEIGITSLSDLEEKYGALISPRALTGRSGIHVYTAPCGLKSRKSLLPKLDTRGNGGFVVVPPSVGELNPYAWIIQNPLSEEPLVFCDASEIKELYADQESKPLIIGDPVAVEDSTARALLMMARIPLVTIADGTRNETLFRFAASLRSRACDEAQIYKLICQANQLLCVPPIDDDSEIRKICHSAASKAVSQAYADRAEEASRLAAEAVVARARAEAAKANADAARGRVGRAEERAAKASETADRKLAKAKEQEAMATLASSIDSGNKDLIRELLKSEIGLPIKRVIQVGKDNTSYYLDIEGYDKVFIGTTITSKDKIGETIVKHIMNLGFIELPAKKWPAVRRGLISLIEIVETAETERASQFIGWIASLYHSQGANSNFEKNYETIRRRQPFVEGGFLWFSVQWIGQYLANYGVKLSMQEIAARLSEINAYKYNNCGIVSETSEIGTRVQARYWGLCIKDLELDRSSDGQSEAITDLRPIAREE